MTPTRLQSRGLEPANCRGDWRECAPHPRTAATSAGVRDFPTASGQSAAFLVIGDTPLGDRIRDGLLDEGELVDRRVDPGDDELVEALARQPGGVAIATHDDVVALRYALAVAHVDSAVPIVVTIFDRTISNRVAELLPQAVVTSTADLAAPRLAAACLASGSPATGGFQRARDAIRLNPKGPRRTPRDLSDRLLLLGLVGLAAVLVTDFLWLWLRAGHLPADALLEAARVVATVGPGPVDVPAGYATFASLAMLASVCFTALFTAGLVERLLEPRLVALVGARRVPRRGHVIVVGIGQVGIRLCAELRRRGVRVVGVERDPSASQLHVARALRIPVVVGHGSDRDVLERLGLGRALAIAAVGSDEYDNIAVAIAANGIAPGTGVVMRAGEQEAMAETRSLLPLGETEDVWSIAGQAIVALLLTRLAHHPAIAHDGR